MWSSNQPGQRRGHLCQVHSFLTSSTSQTPRTVEDEEFINMMEKIDKRLTVPKKTKIASLVDQMYLAEKVKFKNRLAMARKVTIGIDIWTKKGLTASFLAVSACYFNVQDSKAEHILLNLKQMVHPHTAHSIATLVEECTEEWGIPKEKILMIITDNGSNMVSAFRHEEDTSSDESNSQDSDEEEEADERYGRLLDKVRHLVRQFCKSSVATERLLEQCGRILIKDCPTRWSSSFLMLSRLLEIKDHVTSVADTMGWDCLLPSEWQKVAILKDLLLPFAEHTKVLESDTSCFSLVVPALLDLKSHLSDFSLVHARSYRDVATLAQKMSADMDLRFSCFLDVSASKFSPLAAAACFVDASVSAEALIENDNDDIQNLLSKAEEYITRSVPYQEEATDDEDIGSAEVSDAPLQKRPRFRFLSAHRPSRPKTSKTSIRLEVQKFKEALSHANPDDSGMDFWSSQSSTMFPLLKPLALDLLAMPASEAFAERVFSLTGDLSSGRRNRARVTLERSAFLKLNKV
ncbi:zinc finger BED domain-containing protein 4-like [Alosa pseudoharengus]|uniref:zinc finger BED domain-containing protein 4-like n=1 Tax=Alosa pseudoharengus TaxID=34774 RepID=UPI003F89ACD8